MWRKHRQADGCESIANRPITTTSPRRRHRWLTCQGPPVGYGSRARPFWLACLLVPLASLVGPAWADEPAGENPIAAILAAWQGRLERAGCVLYRAEAEHRWAKGSFDGHGPADEPAWVDNPPHDVSVFAKYTMLLDLKHNRFRFEYHDPQYSNLSRKVDEIHCLEVGDGTTVSSRIFQGVTVQQGQAIAFPDMFVQHSPSGWLPAGVFDDDGVRFLTGSGIVRYSGLHIHPTALVPKMDSAAFTFVGKRPLNGRECVVLSHGTQEFWIDMEREAALVQEITHPDQPTYRLTIDYQQVEGTWMPAGWTKTHFYDGRWTEFRRLKIRELRINPPLHDDDFKLAIEPGMYVHDVTYRIDNRTDHRMVKSEDVFYRAAENGGKILLDERYQIE